MSTGASKNAQSRASQDGGGQMVGGMKPVSKSEVNNFLGKSGQGDNQTTNRGKGKT